MTTLQNNVSVTVKDDVSKEGVSNVRICRKSYGYSRRKPVHATSHATSRATSRANACGKCKKYIYKFCKVIGGCLLFITCLPCICYIAHNDNRLRQRRSRA